MRNQQAFISISLFLALAACGTAPKMTVEATKFDAPKYLSLRENPRATNQCPRNDKTWRKENQRQLMTLANACVLEKNWQRVDQIGEHLAGLAADAPWGAFYMSVGSLGLDRLPRALWMADLALKKSPRASYVHYQKGRVLWAMGEFELSVKATEDAVKFDPNLLDARYLLAQVYFRDHEWKKARQHFQAVTRLSPANAEGYVGVGETLWAEGDKHGSRVAFEQAVNLSPNDYALRMRLADIYETEKMLPEALATYKKARDLANAEKKAAARADLMEKITLLEKMVQDLRPAKKVSSLRAPAQDEKGTK